MKIQLNATGYTMPAIMEAGDAHQAEIVHLKTELRLHQIVLAELVAQLPGQRYWLDMDTEKRARQLVKRAGIKT